MPSESEWNQAVFDWYFGPHVAGRPVYLSFDEAAAAAIAESKGWSLAEPLADLRSSLRLTLEQTYPFTSWLRLAQRRSARSVAIEPPCFVHVLALTVLPATARALDDSPAGYYAPLFAALGIRDSDARRADYRESVPTLWRKLGAWLQAQNGMFGMPTAREGHHATAYLGWSRSQAIVRSADRSTFIDFFLQSGYEPGERPPVELLLARFEQWARRSRVSDRVRAAFEHAERRTALGEILLHDLETWDGDTRDEDFHSVHRVVPRLNARRRALTWVLLCDKDFGGLFDDAGQEAAAAGSDRVHWLPDIRLLPTPKRDRWCVGGMRVEARHEPVHVFEEDLVLGGYTSVPRMTEGRAAWVLVSSAGAPGAIEFLRARGLVAVDWPALPGWKLFKDVRVPVEAVAYAPPILHDKLPALGLRASLQGGLGLGRGSYLVGFAPDLVLPESPIPLDVELDGSLLRRVEPGRREELPLAALATGLGPHTIAVGDQRLRFELVVPAPPSTATDRLCHVIKPHPNTLLDFGSLETVGATEVGVSGAHLVAPSAHQCRDRRTWAPASDGWLAIAQDGRSTFLPPTPAWVTSALREQSCHMSVDDARAVVTHPVDWLARVMRQKVLIHHLCDKEPPTAPVARHGAFGERDVYVGPSSASRWVEVAGRLASRSVFPARHDATPTWANQDRDANTMPVDRVLWWCSVRGSGRIHTFVEAFQWLTGNHLDRTIAHQVLRNLSRLGHVEVNWHAGRWSATPTTLVVPTNAGGLSFIVGARCESLVADVERYAEAEELDVDVAVGSATATAPSVLMIRSGNCDDLVTLARLMGFEVAWDPSSRLSELLPCVDRMIRTGAVPFGFERRRVIVDEQQVRYVPVYDDTWEGSYEHDSYGALVYSIRDAAHDENPYLVDRSTAVWFALRQAGRRPAVYDAESRTFRVPAAFGLPLLHERCLVLATGVLPRFEVAAGGLRILAYPNVAPRTAARILETLTT